MLIWEATTFVFFMETLHIALFTVNGRKDNCFSHTCTQFVNRYVNQNLHNSQYNITPHLRFNRKITYCLDSTIKHSSDFLIALTLESFVVMEQSGKTTSNLKGFEPYCLTASRRLWDLADLWRSAEALRAFVAKMLLHHRKMAQLCVFIFSLPWFFMWRDQWEDV